MIGLHVFKETHIGIVDPLGQFILLSRFCNHLTRGFFQREVIKPSGFLTGEINVFPALSEQVDIKPSLTAKTDAYSALKGNVNVIN